MFAKTQLLLWCMVATAFALDHHHPVSEPGYRGAGYAGYTGPASRSPYGSYADYASVRDVVLPLGSHLKPSKKGQIYASAPQAAFSKFVSIPSKKQPCRFLLFQPPEPYNFGYDTVDEFGNRQFRSEQGDTSNRKTGSYGYRDVNGLYRRVNYVADANGFRATVDTNEPGTAPGASADAVFNAAPVVPPVPSGGPLAYGAGAAVPYNGYAGNGRYGYGAFGRAGGVYGSIPYGGYGGFSGSPALGGYTNGYGLSVLAAGSYTPGSYGVPREYNGLTSGPYGYRRR
ncbi:hypothetical protein HPB48_003991 [Haemaphysalis longicornis]|uniref:Cuticle protein n=1 Tax=Haemaphysalis longicornis TaxID=44386 RepID=A0A9J6G7A4_HAELO|nr:hypothetical protein HPB48_003991 [Haemaphysalis longicornis]